MTVLIMTEPDDIHAVLVHLALEQKGYKSNLFFSADMPSIQKNNLYFSNGENLWNTKNNENDKIEWDLNSIDSIWWRRPRRPHIPDHIHEDDKRFVQKENAMYHDSIPYMLNDNAWWVNPIESTYKTRSKITQLKLAQKCGLKLPETLISNSPEDIKNFLKNSKNDGVIYKPFAPHYWADNNGMRLLYTDKISLKDLPSDEMLQVVPGIYQKYIEKKFELRVTCFGSHISAVKIHSQQHSQGQTDWRKIPGHELALSPYELTQPIKDKIIQFMKETGVVFGCFDFIVTPDDDVVFLELNEQGQFLWVEDILPELCYMDMFAEFMIQKRFDFSWKQSSSTLSTKDFDDKAQKICDENINKHVYLNQVKRVA
ncbi:hypothetical protein [Legionella yabuuchiae]|uniref:hypothetical protein n=1 Tax=Legionella yabuuchiae TaxID=376727 RepID=UPI001056A7D7|nr:hypothetical protein [Legionella yabuuchiae]